MKQVVEDAEFWLVARAAGAYRGRRFKGECATNTHDTLIMYCFLIYESD